MNTFSNENGGIYMNRKISWSNRYRDADEQYLFDTEPNRSRIMLLAYRADWENIELVEYEDQISEGIGHRGHPALLGMVARKPCCFVKMRCI